METSAGDGSRVSRNDARLKRALKHPVRSQIFVAAAEAQPVSLPALAGRLGLSVPQLRYHYGVLTALGALPTAE